MRFLYSEFAGKSPAPFHEESKISRLATSG